MRTVKKCDDVPPTLEHIDVEFLAVKNDVVLLLLGSKIKLMVNQDKGFSDVEIDWLKRYAMAKIKTLGIIPSAKDVKGLVVVDIIGDLRALINQQ